MRAADGRSVGGAPGSPYREALGRQQSAARPANAARVFETTGPGVPRGSPVA